MYNFSFEGSQKKHNYFEGWYIKINDIKNNEVYAFILGITLYKQDPHAFIMVISPNQKTSHYYRFNKSDFHYTENKVIIKNNKLTSHSLKIVLDDLKVDVNFSKPILLKKQLFNNSIMSYFKYLPLSTSHEIIFLKASVSGEIINNQSKINISGNCYMEKTMGNKFPKQWLWIEANNFNNPNAALVIAIADIFYNFKGFFCVLNINNKEYRFATYNGSKVSIIKNNSDNIEIVIKKKDIMLNIKTIYKDDYFLTAPTKNGKMKKIINESLNSNLTFTLYEKNKNIVSDTSNYVGCENLY
ncbi:MAG: tocopherol cyclase family protein [Bacilli bacterium]|nr:tocopherol cyclase family protein [Bacilli bacterium]